MSQQITNKKVTNRELLAMKARGEKIVSLTAYDASFAHIQDEAGVDLVLVGDSLGMVVQGKSSTVPVSIDEMAYHAKNVSRGLQRALLVVDMPFMSYSDPQQAATSAAILMQKGNAEMVKLEGGASILSSVERLVSLGIPVCGHLGLLPQSVNQLGGYRVQGRGQQQAEQMIKEAISLEKAGASALVVECIPAALAKKISNTLTIPVIGIGAGVDCDGQVLVSYDMLDITFGKRPKFSKNFMADAGSVSGAVCAYVEAVRSKTFPSCEHTFE